MGMVYACLVIIIIVLGSDTCSGASEIYDYRAEEFARDLVFLAADNDDPRTVCVTLQNSTYFKLV